MIKASFLVCAALLAAAPALASGSYSNRPPRPPAAASAKMDQEKYTLGQKVYEGSAMTAGGGDAAAQTPRLTALQAKLPADAAKMKNLVALAGKISATQLDALEYFVAQRFGMKK
ncbi:MAG: hypothetical protein Q8N18_23045 [Opitutaceae bacterium]|nr:hypothetical protein [Opitutaceae bacterium]